MKSNRTLFRLSGRATAACCRRLSSGYETTLNGYGVNLADPLGDGADPFVKAWIDDTARLPQDAAGLEVGAAFGSATLAALQQGAPTVLANDLEGRHLAALRERWNAWSDDFSNRHSRVDQQRLVEIPGAAPSALATSAAHSRNIHTILMANVIHFLSPDDIESMFVGVRSLVVPGARLYVSLDSPWTMGYRPLWPLYIFNKHLLKSPHPGAHRVSEVAKRLLIPERLRGAPYYHVMEPEALRWFLERSGWHVAETRYFGGDKAGNPAGVNLDGEQGGKEMCGAMAVKPAKCQGE